MRNKKSYVWLTCLVVALSVTRVGIPHLYGKIVNALTEGNTGEATRVFGILNVVWLLYQFMSGWASWIESQKTPELYSHLREWLFEMIAKSNQGKEVDVGGALNKLQRFPVGLVDYFDIIRDFISGNIITIIVTIVYLFRIHSSLGWIFLLLLVCSMTVGWWLDKKCNYINEKSEEVYDKANSAIEDVLSNLPAVHGARTADKECLRVRKILGDNNICLTKSSQCQMPFRVLFVILGSLALIGINKTSLGLLREKKIDLSQCVSVFIISYSSILSVVMNTYIVLRDLLVIRGRLNMVRNYLETLNQEGDEPTQAVVPSSSMPQPPKAVSLRLVDVISKPGMKAPISGNLPGGSRILIRGYIGVGKTTLAKVLSGLGELTQGQIMDSGTGASLTPTELRKLVFYVPQTPNLFNRSLFENIVYGLDKEETITKGTVLGVLRQAGLHEVAQRFGENLGRPAGRKGSNFSGGERQLVWLIRASLQKRPIIILDEPTASLDPTSKHNVERMIQAMSTNSRTVVVITHEESLLKGWFTQEITFGV